MSLIKMLVFGLSFLVFIPVLAADVCSAKSETQSIDSCYAKLKNDSEKRLNDEYAAFKRRITENYSTDKDMSERYSSKLLSAQRSWLKYRDQQCAMESLFADSGSQANATLVNKCISRIDEQRIKEMQSLPY
ncbi:lysozyme inhibitor LprI family protein [Siccibacter turicensis]|uniref:lysozyme inhibitor LprI family protein n=1 Tax=Siccibacter turicensis TaxID=357233 RepID=UPI002A6A94F7|nr:lysozyme inhibitor LprI family protein [Siccibacter turicensis]MDY0973315.1 lysozyme inhibitor LprI family protein [Siccibacter turicensis]